MNKNGKSSRENGYYGPSLGDLTVGALCVIAIAFLAVLAVALLTCGFGEV